ncbi:hypothetical protein RFI_08846, partial [Reticulomyxa filosa]
GSLCLCVCELLKKEIRNVFTAYGHQGRVLRTWISDSGNHIASTSEDSTCRIWSFDGHLLDVFDFRMGAIWSIDGVFKPNTNAENGGGIYYCALGGADSSIRLHFFLKMSSNMFAPTSLQSGEGGGGGGSSYDTNLAVQFKLGNNGSSSSSSSPLPSPTPSSPFPLSTSGTIENHHAFYHLMLPDALIPSGHRQDNSTTNYNSNTSDYNNNSKSNTNSKTSSRRNSQQMLSIIRSMLVDSKQQLYVATKNRIFRISNLGKHKTPQWKQVVSLRGNLQDVTCMMLCNDFYQYNTDNHLEDDDNNKDGDGVVPMPMSMTIPSKFLKDATFVKTWETDKWLIVGTREGKVGIIDVQSNRLVFCFRAHDVGIVALFACFALNATTVKCINKYIHI